MAHGGWVVINNSHLSIKFMCEVEMMVNDIKERYKMAQGGEEGTPAEDGDAAEEET